MGTSAATGAATSKGTGAGRAKKERESQLADILAANGLFRSQETIAARIAVAEVDRNNAEVARLQHIERSVQLLHEAATIERSNVPLDEKQAQLRGVQDKLVASTNQYEREIATEKIAQVKAANEIIADLELELKLKTATTEQERERLRLEAERAKLEAQLQGLPQPQIDQITQLQAQVAAPLTDAQNIEQRIGKLKDEVAELTNIGNIAITVADGIGAAFSQAFAGLISGSMSAREALSSFFKSVGDMFLEMASEIIAKQMTMIILQTILKALGAVAGGGGGGGNFSGAFGGGGPSFNPGAFSMPALAADGATFTNGIAKFAQGGIVGSPTLFKFADGGTTRTGLMGEAGPEAIMPLKRGADGSLGVQANGLRDAMDKGRSGSGSPVLNMSFQSTNINGVEYVSRDQLEQAMAQTRRQASRDGAQRGMSMTLDKLQQSPSTRNRVGIR
jgi:lambda family phage tail tape measure protein